MEGSTDATAPRCRCLNRTELMNEIVRVCSSSPDTILHIDLKGRNPDDGATTIPYNKGAALLKLIEQTVGRQSFDAWLKGYLDRHAFQSITTAMFLADLRGNLIRDPELEKKLRLDEWIYKPGLPDNALTPASDALARVEQDAKTFAGGAKASTIATKNWTTQEWQHFLESLPKTLTPEQLGDLDRTFGLSKRGNSEVLFDWLRIAIRNHYEPAMPALEHFLTSQGRRKFLRPLYEDLMAADWGKPLARKIYAEARPLYHAVSTGTLDRSSAEDNAMRIGVAESQDRPTSNRVEADVDLACTSRPRARRLLASSCTVVASSSSGHRLRAVRARCCSSGWSCSACCPERTAARSRLLPQSCLLTCSRRDDLHACSNGAHGCADAGERRAANRRDVVAVDAVGATWCHPHDRFLRDRSSGPHRSSRSTALNGARLGRRVYEHALHQRSKPARVRNDGDWIGGPPVSPRERGLVKTGTVRLARNV